MPHCHSVHHKFHVDRPGTESGSQWCEMDDHLSDAMARQALVTPFIFYWTCISLRILANNQLDALFRVFIYFICLHVSSITVLIIRRSNCINTSSGMISPCKWLLGMPVRKGTSWCHTVWSQLTSRSGPAGKLTSTPMPVRKFPSWPAYQAVTYTD